MPRPAKTGALASPALAVCLAVGLASPAWAALELPSFLASHMVLQRGGAQLWGWGAAPGAAVTVNVTVGPAQIGSGRAHAGPDGAWTVPVTITTPQPTSTVAISTGAPGHGGSALLTDVAWGDVFLCGGQSNMEYPMADAFDGAAERLAAGHPGLRMLNLKDISNVTDNTDCPSKAPYTWAASSPATISARDASAGGAPANPATAGTIAGPPEPPPPSFGTRFPSAVCWFAARDLIVANPSVPIGIITAAKSGSAIELWMPEQAILDGTPASYGGNGSCGGAATPPDRPAKSPRNLTCPRGGITKSGGYFRGMIAPLTKMRLTGVWWYQGEENDHAEDACPGPVWYRCLFPAMIKFWRGAFMLPDLPFYYVLLAGGHSAVMREAQVAGASAIAHTAFASAMDLSAQASEYLIPGHPPRKQEVGRRVSLLVRGLIYGGPLDYTGPKVIGDKVSVTQTASNGDNSIQPLTTVVIPFEVGANGFLHLNGTGGCTTCCSGASDVSAAGLGHGRHGYGVSQSNPSSPVALVDPDAPLVNGTAKVVKTQTFEVDARTGTLIATLPGWHSTAGKVEVRFLFDNAPQCAVYNGELSGPDSYYAATPHFGIVAQSWRANLTVATAG